MCWFLLLLLIKFSIKHVVASAHAQLFPLVITVRNTFVPLITVGNTFTLIITVGNRFPLVITVGNTFPLLITSGNMFRLVITVGNKFLLVITVENTFPLLLTVRKNNGSSFFLKKRSTSKMSSIGHRRNVIYLLKDVMYFIQKVTYL